jgi:hypothetical protein
MPKKSKITHSATDLSINYKPADNQWIMLFEVAYWVAGLVFPEAKFRSCMALSGL